MTEQKYGKRKLKIQFNLMHRIKLCTNQAVQKCSSPVKHIKQELHTTDLDRISYLVIKLLGTLLRLWIRCLFHLNNHQQWISEFHSARTLITNELAFVTTSH